MPLNAISGSLNATELELQNAAEREPRTAMEWGWRRTSEVVVNFVNYKNLQKHHWAQSTTVNH